MVEANARILGGDGIEVSLLEVEAGAVEILRHDLDAAGLGDDSEPALRGPAEQDLRRLLAVLGGEPGDQLVLHERGQGLRVLEAELEEGRGPERRVRRHRDPLRLAQADELLLHEEGVVLDLQRGRRDRRVPQHVVDQLRLEVGYPDRLGEPLADERLHRCPGDVHWRVRPDQLRAAVVVPTGGVAHGWVDVLEGAGEVDQVQVEVLEPPVGERAPAGWLDFVAVLEDGPELGCDEEVLALHDPFLDGARDALATFLFVAVVCMFGIMLASPDFFFPFFSSLALRKEERVDWQVHGCPIYATRKRRELGGKGAPPDSAGWRGNATRRGVLLLIIVISLFPFTNIK